MSATKRMIDFAQEIAAVLNIPEPDYEDFEDVHNFIDENKRDFYTAIDGVAWQR